MRKKQEELNQLSCINEKDININIGSKLKKRRQLMKMSQTQLGEAIGLSFQQIQKYEKGVNKLSLSRILRVAEVLDVGLEYFLEGIEKNKDC